MKSGFENAFFKGLRLFHKTYAFTLYIKLDETMFENVIKTVSTSLPDEEVSSGKRENVSV